jgi:hypothetical protein
MADIDDALWCVERISELLASAPRLEHSSLRGVTMANLRACVDNVAGRNVDAFAHVCRVSRTPLEFYLNGKNVPTIEFCCGYLLRDRDRIFAHDFVEQVQAMGIKQVLSAPRSPWQRAMSNELSAPFVANALIT